MRVRCVMEVEGERGFMFYDTGGWGLRISLYFCVCVLCVTLKSL
jgi:hypothetical protein